MSNPICDSCKQPMVLAKQFETKPRGKKKTKYRIRRFKCELCDIGQTVFADGEVDKIIVQNAVDAAKLDAEDFKGEKL